jgi:hypothetical protein
LKSILKRAKTNALVLFEQMEIVSSAEGLIVHTVFPAKTKKIEKIKTFCILLTYHTQPFYVMYHLMYFEDFHLKTISSPDAAKSASHCAAR